MINTMLLDLVKRFGENRSSISLSYIMKQIIDFDADLSEIRDWAINIKVCTLSGWNKALVKAKRDCKLVEILGAVPISAIDFVTRFAERTQAQFLHNGVVYMADPDSGRVVESTNSSFARRARLADHTLGLGYGTNVVIDAVDEYVFRAIKERRPAIIAGLRYDASASFDWITLARAAFDEDPEYAAALIQHTIWQVKRKALGLEITRHLMLIFGGAQEVGKSTLMRAICSPIEELVRNATFSQITDDRIFDIWDASVILMDEMSFASKADADEVKNVITADILDRRPMRSNKMDRIRQMATLVGTTNKPLEMLIRDVTGNRRFGYLCYTSKPDFEVINSCDWVAAWRTVDESAESPIMPFLAELKEHQASSRVQSTVEQWIDQIDGQIANYLDQLATTSGVHAIRAADLYDDYRNWEDSAGVQSREKLDLAGFRVEMKRLSEMTSDPVFTFKTTSKFNGFCFDRSRIKSVNDAVNDNDASPSSILDRLGGMKK